MADERRNALERRVWRLAFLLTGDREGAAALVDRILDAQANLDALEPARLDRLVILQAREMMGVASLPPADFSNGPLQERALRAAHAMGAQAREAWVLARVDIVDELWMSRAMDCSRTAARQHLAGADEVMRSRLGGDYDAAVMELRKFADSLDPGPIIAANRRKRHRRRLERRMAAGIIVAVVILGAAVVLLRTRVI